MTVVDAPLLTLVVPTFNRSAELARLLAVVASELSTLMPRVEVVIGDNASSDDTFRVIADFCARVPPTRVLHHAQNLGAEENFCRCLELVRTPYVWLMGDDDLPLAGVLAQVIDLLASQSPDLLYLHSEWSAVPQPRPGPVALQAQTLGAEDFTRRVHVWLTFISGMVVHWERLRRLAPDPAWRRFSGTSLVQLGWVLPLVQPGGRLLVVNQACVLATSGNTGGYRLFEVFGRHFIDILDASWGPASRLRRLVVWRLVWDFLPGLLWAQRFGQAGQFVAEDALVSLQSLRGSLAYWLVLWPIARLPKVLARPVLALAWLVGGRWVQLLESLHGKWRS